MTENHPGTAPPPRRALDYPYDIPGESYVIEGGCVRPVAGDACLGDLGGRTPVLAVGSNQSPEALTRKFPHAVDGPIPVVRACLRGFDSVYSAHFSSYGSVPATLHPSPGTAVTLFVNWLDAPQLARMNDSEMKSGNYLFGRLDEIDITVEAGPDLTSVYFYAGTHGALTIDGCPVPLAEVPAENRPHPALGQIPLQNALSAIVSNGEGIDDFVSVTITDPVERTRRRDCLKVDALSFRHPAFQKVNG